MNIQISMLRIYVYCVYNSCVVFILCNASVPGGPSYGRDALFNNLQCPTIVYGLGTARGRLDCSQRCFSHSECRSFFYNAISKSCFGTDSVIASTAACTTLTGNEYYATTDITTTTTTTPTTTTRTTTTTTPTTTTTTTMTTIPTTTTTITTSSAPQLTYGTTCSLDSDCLIPNTKCLDGTCHCLLGYKLITATQTCTSSCTTYINTYTLIPDMALDVSAIGSQTGVSLSQCTAYCSTFPTCKGFNFCRVCGNMCRCKVDSPTESPSSWTSSSGVDYYSRNCGL